jgi:hypothetical protein
VPGARQPSEAEVVLFEFSSWHSIGVNVACNFDGSNAEPGDAEENFGCKKKHAALEREAQSDAEAAANVTCGCGYT